MYLSGRYRASVSARGQFASVATGSRQNEVPDDEQSYENTTFLRQMEASLVLLESLCLMHHGEGALNEVVA
jgi:hypothetical protein